MAAASAVAASGSDIQLSIGASDGPTPTSAQGGRSGDGADHMGDAGGAPAGAASSDSAIDSEALRDARERIMHISFDSPAFRKWHEGIGSGMGYLKWRAAYYVLLFGIPLHLLWLALLTVVIHSANPAMMEEGSRPGEGTGAVTKAVNTTETLFQALDFSAGYASGGGWFGVLAMPILCVCWCAFMSVMTHDVNKLRPLSRRSSQCPSRRACARR